MSDEVLVDVGVPTFGSPKYIVQALDSVLAQTFTGWRLTDLGQRRRQRCEIVQPYLADPRVAYRVNELILPGERGAAAGNWSGLVEDAKAPYVALLHDDDWWGPTSSSAASRSSPPIPSADWSTARTSTSMPTV